VHDLGTYDGGNDKTILTGLDAQNSQGVRRPAMQSHKSISGTG
jgi:hypothetical protein